MVRAEGQPAKAVLSGVQISFPKWSGSEPKLTLWASYRFAQGSLSAWLIGAAAPPGDPALVLDAATGRLDWQPVSARDKVQIGHYYLIRGDAATAWGYYEAAEREFAADKTPAGAGSPRPSSDFYTGRNADLFRALCLERLGRHDEAREYRRRFEAAFPSKWSEGMGPSAKTFTAEEWRFVRDLYVVEVLLSVNGADEAERYLSDALKTAAEPDRLGKALLLTQVLLLRGKNAAYADLAVDTVLPLLLKVPVVAEGPERELSKQTAELLHLRLLLLGSRLWGADPRDLNLYRLLLTTAASLPLSGASLQALLPLATPRFLATLPQEQVRRLTERIAELRRQESNELRCLGLDFLLAGAHGRLGEKERRQEVLRRIAENQAWQGLIKDTTAEEVFRELDEAGR
jgi:hypothetical protein